MIHIIYLEKCPFSERALALLKRYKLKHKLIKIKRNEKEDAKKIYDIKSFPNLKIIKTKNRKKISLEIGGCDNFEKYLNTINYIKNEDINTKVLCSLTNLIR